MLRPAQRTINPAYLGNRTKRLLAFFIDIFPISFLVIMFYRQFFDYDTMLDAFLLDYDNPEVREPFMKVQNEISTISLFIYILYAFALEASVLGATYGKKLMGLCVVRYDGAPLTPREALWRNIFKIVSQIVLNLGFIWILIDQHKRGWHDMIGKTLVIEKEYENSFLRPSTPSITKKDIQIIKAPILLRKISEGNQSNLLFAPNISKQEFPLLVGLKIGSKQKFDHYYKALIQAVDLANSNISEDVIWNNSTLGQKIIRVFKLFMEDMAEGDLKSFFFNHPEYFLTLTDVFEEINAGAIQKDYQDILSDLSFSIQDDRLFSLEGEDLSSRDLWEMHVDQYLDTDRHTLFIQTYMGPNSSEVIYSRACAYIENHLELFL